METIDLILKIGILFFLAASSEVSFKARRWGTMLVTLGLWLTVFRLAILRAISVYVGVFTHTPDYISIALHDFLQDGWIVVVTDAIAFIGALLAFVLIAATLKDDYHCATKKRT